jgi:hypothetical protein
MLNANHIERFLNWRCKKCYQKMKSHQDGIDMKELLK